MDTTACRGGANRIVNRDLLPLPLDSFDAGPEQAAAPLSRRCQRRLGTRAHASQWARECAQTLNDLDAGSQGSRPWSVRASAAQERSLAHIRAAVEEMGRPPADMTRQGALAELLARRSYTGDRVAVADLDIDLLSLPTDSSPVELGALLGAGGPKVVEEFIKQKVLPTDLAEERRRSSRVKRACMDPSLRGRPRRYARLLDRMNKAGMIEWRRAGQPRVGLFAVWKKSGKQRLIADARVANLGFAEPDPVSLATGTAFSNLEVDSGPALRIAQVDLKDCFYHLLMPPELVSQFCLDGVAAGLVGLKELDGEPVAPTTTVFPHLRVVPMGWNHALWWAQTVHEHVAYQVPGIVDANKMRDRAPGGQLSQVEFMHTEYVDNFATLGYRAEDVTRAAAGVEELFNQLGLPTHPLEVTDGGELLGWTFGETSPTVRLSSRRVWKIRLGIEGLIERGGSG